jgi:hypothetical protein
MSKQTYAPRGASIVPDVKKFLSAMKRKGWVDQMTHSRAFSRYTEDGMPDEKGSWYFIQTTNGEEMCAVDTVTKFAHFL